MGENKTPVPECVSLSFRIYGGHEIAKRDNTNCKQMAAHESLQIREPRLLVAVSVGYAACAALSDQRLSRPESCHIIIFSLG